MAPGEIKQFLWHENRNKGMKHSWINFPPIEGFEPTLPELKSNVLTTEPKSQLPDAVVRDWIYIYKLCIICQGRLSKVVVIGRNTPTTPHPPITPLFKKVIIYDDTKPFSAK